MSRYRKIDPRIWNDEKFRLLSDRARLVFFMLLTHPHMTALGGMRATIPGLAAEMGWDEEAFREAFREVSSKGMAEHDPKACLVWLPRFLRYNPPESPNVIKAWANADELIPECQLKTRVIAAAKAFAEGMGKAFREAFPEALSKGMPYQEQQQEQEQDLSHSVATANPEQPPSARDELAHLLLLGGVKTNSETPQQLAAWEAIGVTLAELSAAVDLAARRRRESGNEAPLNLGYVATILAGERAAAAAPKPKRNGHPNWRATNQGIEDKGRELGLMARPGESYGDYAARLASEVQRRSDAEERRA